MIRLNDFKAEPQALRNEVLGAMQRVLDSGHYVLGPEVTAFESAWAQRTGADHCVGVANGLEAIEIGLRALGIGPGDEVITTSMTAVATVLAILNAGATPVLADIDPSTALLDPASVERCLSPRTKAVLVVHLYGQMRDIAMWQNFCSAHSILLLEDCAQSHDAQDAGLFAGTAGEFGAYSFYPTKNLGALGDAGALITGNSALASTARQLRNYGQSTRYVHDIVGTNSRLDELQAAILLVRMQWLAGFTARRREIASRYHEEVESGAVELLAAPAASENHVYHLFVVRTSDRDRFRAHLESAQIETLIHYPIPVHQQVPMKGLRLDPQGMSHTEAHAALCVSIPGAPHLTDDQVSQVISAVNSFRAHNA